jgi:Na+-driven multidrug efflux pump
MSPLLKLTQFKIEDEADQCMQENDIEKEHVDITLGDHEATDISGAALLVQNESHEEHDSSAKEEPLVIESISENSWKKLFNTTKTESIEMLKIGWPLMVTFVSLTGMQFVDMMFLGRLGDKEYLAGAALATAISYCCVFPIFGTIGAQETLVSQAFGAKNYHVMTIVLLRSILVVTVLCIPVSILWAFSEQIFMLFVRSDESMVASYAATYTRLLIPGLWPFLLFRVYFSYLISQVIAHLYD